MCYEIPYQYILTYWFHTLFVFQMVAIRAHVLLVPFTLLLQDDDHVFVSEDLLSLRFNLRVGIMYIEQELYNVEGGRSN